VPLAKHVKRVISFEAQRLRCDLLWRNVMANHISVDVQEFVVSSAPGRIRSSDGNHDRPLAEGANGPAPAASVPIVTLDDHCRDFERLDLIKIDFESDASEVIAGAQQTIRRLEPLLYVENDRAEASNKLITQITALGYRLYWHFPWISDSDQTAERDLVSTNMICAPRDRFIDMTDLTPITGPYQDWEIACAQMTKPARKRHQPTARQAAE
jgi:FkbM family methyltransferase